MLIELEPILEGVGAGLVNDLAVSQREEGLRASGYSIANTHAVVTREGKSVVLSVIGPAYWKEQQYGRGPNRRKGRPSSRFVETIREWIQIKGIPIPLAAAGAIAYKIVNEGIKVPNPHNKGRVLSRPFDPVKVKVRVRGVLPAYGNQLVKSLLFD
ncbi:hypothetical protein [Spirosoma sp. KUDC1026]|uniref:hypothetical protein n=1 Tax=Spirosoma sp. KUDC1026 TaxID=2745947 RepID=UPI00159BE712|nr:hypothetical protein [Spirosoma sp. KUDC1026]QKZ15190.1 hypothetical protein HU175_22215 [Spirosoma sp. KUDC1026]